MSKAADPFYNRKPVPDELVQGSGIPGLSQEQAWETRERKLSTTAGVAGKGGGDLRKFSNFFSPPKDPFYARKPVPDTLIPGTGIPGVNEEQAWETRERKLSTTAGVAGKGGGDLRKFSNFFSPKDDPFYARKPVPAKLLKDDDPVTNIDPVERYENKERKLSMFTLTNDPFDQLAGRRTSVVNDSAIGVGRRRSSAVAPHQIAEAHNPDAHHSFGGEHLAPIESRADAEPEPEPKASTSSATATEPAALVTMSSGVGEGPNGLVHDQVTNAATTSERTTVA